MRRIPMAVAGAAVLLAAGGASAGVLHYRADLRGAGASSVKGVMTAVLDTDSRALDVTVTGVSGPTTTAGFAAGGEAKPEIVAPIAGASPAHATITLTSAQINELNAGRLSFVVDTNGGPGSAARSGSELRGKVSRSSGVL